MLWINLEDGMLLDLSKTTGGVFVCPEPDQDEWELEKSWFVTVLAPITRSCAGEVAAVEEYVLFRGDEEACKMYAENLHAHLISHGHGVLSKLLERGTNPFDSSPF